MVLWKLGRRAGRGLLVVVLLGCGQLMGAETTGVRGQATSVSPDWDDSATTAGADTTGMERGQRHPFSRFFDAGRATTAPILSLSHKLTTTIQGITFDSNYDNGSLGSVVAAETTAAHTFDCGLYMETGEIGHRRYWFRFRVSGVAGTTLTLNLEHRANPRPVVSVGGGAFRRMSAEEAPDEGRIVLGFGPGEDVAELAFFFPSGYGETHGRVNELVERAMGWLPPETVTTEVLGLSHMGREMWFVTITDGRVPTEGKQRVWVHARAHAGEVTSAHTMLGFLEQMLENTPRGEQLRRHLIVTIVPTLNPDGVALGLTRWDSQGLDPERQWHLAEPSAEAGNMKEKVDKFMRGRNPIRVSLNLHSTTRRARTPDTFFFKHVYPSVSMRFEEIQQAYIDAFDRATPLFDNLDAHTSQLDGEQFIESYFWNYWGESVMAMTHEGHFRTRVTDGEWITDRDYRAIGRALCVALVEFLDLPGPAPSTVDWTIY